MSDLPLIYKQTEKEVRERVVAAAQRAIGCAGGPTRVVEKLNTILPPHRHLTVQAVDRWLDRGIPPKRCIPMELIQARVDRYEMQPEVFGDRP